MKLNVDGAFTTDGAAGVGMVLRNHEGEITVAACRQLQTCADAVEAELAAMRKGWL